MNAETLLFWILASGATLGAIAVVLTQNVVRMAFWLIVSLGSAAGLFFLLNADFVAASQLLVYVGGTVVLLIFGVMLTASGPYNQIKAAPGSLIGVAGVGVVVLFVMYLGMSGVQWDRSVLRQVVISSEKRDEIRENDAETADRIDALYEKLEGQDALRLKTDADLSDGQDAEILAALKTHGLEFSPSSETGGTIRPLGFGLLGARPDKDLNAPEGLQKLSDGFYVEKRQTPREADALSTGYLLPFEIASVHLLVVLIGAAYLARAKRRIDAET